MASVNLSTINLSDSRQVIAAAITLNRAAVISNLKQLGYNASGYTDEQLTNLLVNLNTKYNIVPIINVPITDTATLDQARQYFIKKSDGSVPSIGEVQGKLWYEVVLAALIAVGGAIGIGSNASGQPLPPLPPVETPLWQKLLLYGGGAAIILFAIWYFMGLSKKKTA